MDGLLKLVLLCTSGDGAFDDDDDDDDDDDEDNKDFRSNPYTTAVLVVVVDRLPKTARTIKQNGNVHHRKAADTGTDLGTTTIASFSVFSLSRSQNPTFVLYEQAILCFGLYFAQ